MAQVLHIQVSANIAASVSRQMSNEFMRQWQEKNPTDTVEVLDLALTPARVIDTDHLVATWGDDAALTDGQRQMKAESMRLVGQFVAADIIVISSPVYNFSLPAGFKAYIDQLVVAGKTFQYTSNGPQGLLSGKKAYVMFAGSTPIEMLDANGMNFFGTYIKAIFGFMGITNVTILHVASRTPEAAAEQLKKIKPQIAAVI